MSRSQQKGMANGDFITSNHAFSSQGTCFIPVSPSTLIWIYLQILLISLCFFVEYRRNEMEFIFVSPPCSFSTALSAFCFGNMERERKKMKSKFQRCIRSVNSGFLEKGRGERNKDT